MMISFIEIYIQRVVTISMITVIERPNSRTNEQTTYATWEMLLPIWKDQIYPLIPIHPYIQINKYLLHIKFQKMMVQYDKCCDFSNHTVPGACIVNFIPHFRFLSSYVLM